MLHVGDRQGSGVCPCRSESISRCTLFCVRRVIVVQALRRYFRARECRRRKFWWRVSPYIASFFRTLWRRRNPGPSAPDQAQGCPRSKAQGCLFSVHDTRLPEVKKHKVAYFLCKAQGCLRSSLFEVSLFTSEFRHESYSHIRRADFQLEPRRVKQQTSHSHARGCRCVQVIEFRDCVVLQDDARSHF